MGSEQTRDAEWVQGVTDTNEDRRVSRSAVRAPASAELIGVDGQSEGNLRPFPGMEKGHTFTFAADDASHTNASTILDVFPVTFTIGTDGYAYGFVYRVQRPGGSAFCDVFIDYYNAETQAWTRSTKLVNATVVSPDKDPVDGRQMSVSAFGRFVYVFVEDRSPVRFYLDKDTYGEEILGGPTVAGPFPGPGLRPTFVSHEKNSGLGTITSTGADTERPGWGQVVLDVRPPSEIGIPGWESSAGWTSGTSADDPPQTDADVRPLEPGDYAFAYILNDSKTGLRSGVSEIAQVRTFDFRRGTYGSSSGDLPSTEDDTLNNDDLLEKYAYVEIAWDREKFDQAYIYRSVKTQDAGGTFVAQVLLLEKIITLDEYADQDSPHWYVSSTVEIGQAIYCMEIEDKALIHSDAWVDRSTFDADMPKSGATIFYDGTMLFSRVSGDQVSTVDENRDGDAIGGLGELRWSSLVEPSPELVPPQSRWLPSVPSNAISLFLRAGSSVVGFSRDRQYFVRKESLYLRVQEMQEGFGVVNYKAGDTVGSTAYYVTPKGIKTTDPNGRVEDVRALNKRVTEDWAGDYASVSVAFDAGMSSLFVHNEVKEETLILWFNTGKVTELRDMYYRDVVRGVWPDNWDPSDSTTYDNELVGRAFFVHNPADEYAVGTHRLDIVDSARQKSTQGRLMPVTGIGRADVFAATTGSFTLVAEAAGFTSITIQWVGNTMRIREDADPWDDFDTDSTAYDTLDELVAGLEALSYVASVTRVHRNGNARAKDAKDPLGASLIPSGTYPAPYSRQDGLAEVSLQLGSGLTTEALGSYLYCLDSASTEGDVGSKAQIMDVVQGGVVCTVGLQAGVGGSLQWASRLGGGDRVGVSPVYFRWVGRPLGIESEQMQFGSYDDFFRVRHLSTVTGAFTDLGGSASSSSDAKFRALAYRGDEEEPAAEALPTDAEAVRGSVRSVVATEDGESVYWAAFKGTGADSVEGRYGVDGCALTPGMEVFCPDLDFRLLAVLARGKILGTKRRTRASVGS